MTMSDPVADLLTRIRNGQRANKSSVLSPVSKLRGNVLEVLKSEGYIRAYEIRKDGESEMESFKIELKYHEGKPVIHEISRVSRPGRRVYSKIKDLPRYYGGLGIAILSTPRGVMSDTQARQANVGGEILCQVF
ncbi:MAG: 30S ribosomal protein S8 [Alphaproteobacteria bacterium]|nr:30S ribosomal protein S8 [Alphaproteobacteria bacterium]MDP6660048.1 30S ribosomal protein S8 [Alphaproteobacteria bacterium]MDP6780477.1 30S ribosomal protein S8 [Alphaproteobacteria bacterium]MDP7044392.1 30S ribosomal protein S8 [Alphaproteobacteria bacterium]HAQ33015.1 30S ribosomal protein S8 [Rhodospirillaceae bacterium]